MVQDSLLTMSQLCEALSPHLGGATIHPDRIRRRVKMGLKFHTERGTGRRLFRLSEVLAFWTMPDAVEAVTTDIEPPTGYAF